MFDPKTGHWSSAGTMNEARGYHNAILLADGRVLAVGGDALYAVDTGAETWDPKTNVWTSTGPVKQTRYERGDRAPARRPRARRGRLERG